jgi:hypothetical protein
MSESIDLSFGLGDAIKPIARTVSGLLKDLLHGPATAAGNLARNQINWWNFQNVMRKLTRARELIEEQGLSETEIDLSFLVPWLRAAADTDNSELEELWAQLIANASSASSARHPLFIQTLRSLTPRAARALEVFAADHPEGLHWYADDSFESESLDLDAEILRTLNLMEHCVSWCGDAGDTAEEKRALRALKLRRAKAGFLRLPDNPDRLGAFRISGFGHAFLRAVTARTQPVVASVE